MTTEEINLKETRLRNEMGEGGVVTSVSLAEALPDQIKRVQGLRDRYRDEQREMAEEFGERFASGFNITIAVMTAEIDMAVRAAASGDVIQMLQCYESLKGYSDE